jgi:signal transduction histidine kinase
MGEVLASHKAGRSLGLIVALLIAPVVALWFIYFQEAQVNIQAAKREQAGLHLSLELAPVYYRGVWVPSEGKWAGINEAESALGIQNDAFMKAFARAQKSNARHAIAKSSGETARNAETGARRSAELASLKAQLDRTVNLSKLAVDPDDESYFLIQATLVNLPTLARDYDFALAYIEQKLSDGVLLERELRDITRIVGKVELNRDAFLSNMSVGIAKNTARGSLNGMQLIVAKLNKQIERMTTFVSQASPAGTQIGLKTFVESSIADDKVFPVAAHITQLAGAHIQKRLEMRTDALNDKFYFMTAIGIGFALAGIGVAGFMFRRTLSQLDYVETAKRESDDMANQLSSMNAEMSELNRELAQKMQALGSAQDELLKKGKMEQLGQLTATVAHELRNPLGAVRTSAFLLQRRLKSLNIDADLQFTRINNGISRCDNTITQLLDFSRTKKIVTKSAIIDDWMARCVEEAAAHIPSEIEVQCVLGLGELQLNFDPARLERAIVNLMTNASEALVGKGKDKRQDHVRTPMISIHTFKAGTSVGISVRDNGPGIPPEHLSKIREPLFTTKNFGTGLGIPAVEQIAAQHDGKLSIESEAGKGADFTIWLPLHPEISEAA